MTGDVLGILPPPVVLLDRHPETGAEFRAALMECRAPVLHCTQPNEFASALTRIHRSIGLIDFRTLAEMSIADRARVLELRERHRLGLVADCELGKYVPKLQAWGIHHVLIKRRPALDSELPRFLGMIVDPASGFGLMSHLDQTVQLFTHPIRTLTEKRASIEYVVNHFATCGFEIHELYNVRLILEEMANNAMFHSFRTPDGMEKYSNKSLTRLEDNESVQIEYGSDAHVVGLAVTDNAGTLPAEKVLIKLERQLSEAGVMDTSGRGIYLAYMLSSRIIYNIEPGRRTQVVALFQQSTEPNALKPFFVNEVIRAT